jgi:hypothetical protein
MAPEQISGADPLSPATDLYSVGVLAYTLLCGQHPFPASEQRALLLAHLDQLAPRVGAKVKELPEGLDALVAALLEKRPEQRPESAQEARREVQRIRRKAESAPTLQQGAAVAPLSGLVRTRSFPAAAVARLPERLQQTRNDRSGPLLPRAAPPVERRRGWTGWAVGAALIVGGFGAGWLANRPGVTREDVAQQLVAAREKASTLEAERAREVALAELSALEKRLAAGAAPAEVAQGLETTRASHGL